MAAKKSRTCAPAQKRIIKQQVLGRTSHLNSFDVTWTVYKRTRPTILLLFRAFVAAVGFLPSSHLARNGGIHVLEQTEWFYEVSRWDRLKWHDIRTKFNAHCLKKSFTTLKAYINLFRGHV
jgi:hypothetical protein